MEWEFSSMFTVSLMLIFIPITGRAEEVLENPLVNILPSLTFLFVGIIGGALTDNNIRKSNLVVSISYLVIGLFTFLTVSVSCQGSNCFYITLTILGAIPIGIILTSIGMMVGFQIKERYLTGQI